MTHNNYTTEELEAAERVFLDATYDQVTLLPDEVRYLIDHRKEMSEMELIEAVNKIFPGIDGLRDMAELMLRDLDLIDATKAARAQYVKIRKALSDSTSLKD